MKFILIDKKDSFIISEFRVSKIESHYIRGDVWNVISWCDNNEPYEYLYFAAIHVKWDGCSHFYFNGQELEKNDSYYHMWW